MALLGTLLRPRLPAGLLLLLPMQQRQTAAHRSKQRRSAARAHVNLRQVQFLLAQLLLLLLVAAGLLRCVLCSSQMLWSTALSGA
jgi:hypothetical protein